MKPIFFALIVFATTAIAQKPRIQIQKNYISILPSDKESDIIRKAATVTPSARQLRWQQLELTAFFHFGINTFTNHEWGNGKEDIRLFNPKDLDARQWIRSVKEAGIKQVIITAKHHDGFCLWPSKYTDHCVKNASWKNGKGDVVKEVAEACKEYGIGFGVYLSPWDRNSAYYGSERYNRYFMDQLTELLTNYGTVNEVWFDGANGEGPNGKKQEYDFNAWYHLIRKLQPSAVIAIMGPDVRWVGTESGKGRETEWSVLPVDAQWQEKIAAGSQTDITFAPKGDMTDEDLGSREKILKAKGLVWYPAETDVSIRPGWFYHPEENGKVKSGEQLLDIYFTSVGRNGLLLLNIPPDIRGQLNEKDVSALRDWKKISDKTFRINVARGSTMKSKNGLNVKSILDGRRDSYFTTPGDSTASIEFTLTGPKTFDVLLLQENIRIGQRIERFILEYFAGSEWIKITTGTTVGYKRILRFPAVTANKVRLTIQSSRLNPTIAEFGLYKLYQSK